ncbi:MAG TPA: hypothetical protein VJS15_04860 [Allosphingosinicella sp.]|nr:hypothetical protein [Allosphingosinicella sp.]
MCPRSTEPADPLAFEPVPVRHRRDGWTPEKQREYVEALADTGLRREAAARVGMTEQSASRLRRRADARAFDLACEAALPHGARRLHAIAWERAIEGTVKGHYYHGELKSEERVYDNRLLIYLLGKTQHLVEPSRESWRVARDWEGWMEAIEQDASPPPGPGEGLPDIEVWQESGDGSWWTRFFPPAGFDGEAEGRPGSYEYRRRLSEAEQAVVDEWKSADAAEEEARRDDYFGFEGGSASFPMGAEPTNLSPGLSGSTSPAAASMEPPYE